MNAHALLAAIDPERLSLWVSTCWLCFRWTSLYGESRKTRRGGSMDRLASPCGAMIGDNLPLFDSGTDRSLILKDELKTIRSERAT